MTSLRIALRTNAATCLFFGLLFLAFSGPVAAFLGTASPILVAGVGACLIAHAAHLIVAAHRPELIPAEVLWFAAGDMLWWLATLTLLALPAAITTTPASIAASLTAIGVAGLGLTQIVLLRRMTHGQAPSLPKIAQSWQAMPTWVKGWLVVLNITFLAAFALLPADIARISLFGYAASGPLLAAFILHDEGLTRRLGIAHLVAWVPLLVWLVWQMAQPGQPQTEVVYGAVLSTVLVICLAFDLYDLWRWHRGERSVFTTALPAGQKP